MDKLKKLYDVLVRDGKYSKSFEEFQQQYQDPNYQKKVFDVVSRDGLYSKDFNSFTAQYSGKIQGVTAPDAAVAPGEGTGLASEDTSSELAPDANWFDQTWLGRGIAAASTTGEAADLYMEGSEVNIETVREFVKAKEEEARNYVPSERMDKFQKKYQGEGSTWMAFFRNVKKDPALMAELFVQSLGTQIGTAIDSPEALAAAGTGATAGGVTGAVATSYGYGAGAVPGALVGGMGALAASMETTLTFGELIETELHKEGKEFTDENIKALLEGPKGKSIRNKAIGRGITIGAVEALSGGVAGKAATGTASAVARSVKTVGRGALRSKLAGTAVGFGVEGIGGGLGEVGGRLAAGQEMDPAEIGFEAITGGAIAPVTVFHSILKHKTPTYKLNGKEVTYAEMKDFVDTADGIDVATADIQIENDFTGIGKKAAKKQSDAIIESQVDNKITDQADREKLVELDGKRRKAKADVEKTGTEAVPGAQETLDAVEKEISDIIGKYEGATDVAVTEEAAAVRKAILENRLSETIAFAEAAGKKIGKHVKVVDNNDSAQEAFNKIKEEHNENAREHNAKPENANNQIDLIEDQNVTDADGFIVGDAIVINKEVAGQTGAITVGSHEILHGILAKHLKSLETDVTDANGNVIGKDKTKVKELISSFKDVLSKKQLDAITKRLEENYKQDMTDTEFAEFLETTDEWFTAFSDAILKGEITFEETLFTRIRDILHKIFKTYDVNKEFKDGRAAYNFLREYTKNVKEGQLGGRAIALAGGGQTITEMRASRSARVGNVTLTGRLASPSTVNNWADSAYRAGLQIQPGGYWTGTATGISDFGVESTGLTKNQSVDFNVQVTDRNQFKLVRSPDMNQATFDLLSKWIDDTNKDFRGRDNVGALAALGVEGTLGRRNAPRGVTLQTLEIGSPSVDQGVSFSRSKAVDAVNLIEERIKRAATNRGNRYTKAGFQESKEFEEVYNSVASPGGAINNYIRSLAMSPEKTEETINSVTDRLINYDPEAQRKGTGTDPITLGEFIMANVGYAKKDAAKKLAVEGAKRKQETRLDAKDKTGRTVAETVADTTDEVDVETKREQRARDLSNLTGLDIENIEQIDSEITAKVEALIEQNPVDLEQQITNLIEKEFSKIIADGMGGISQDTKTKKVTVSDEYKAFHALNYERIVSSLSDEVIKNNYKNLFNLEKVGVEDKVTRKADKPGLKKDSYYRKNVFKINTNKALWTKYFTEGGYTTLLARKRALGKLIAKDIVRKAVNNYIEANSTDIDAITTAKLNNFSQSINNQRNQIGSFDTVKYSRSQRFVDSIIADTGKLYRTGKFPSKGHALEQAVNNFLRKQNIPNLKVLVEVATEQDGMADLYLGIESPDGTIENFGVEIKLGTKDVRLTSNRISEYSISNGKVKLTEKSPYSKDGVDIVDRQKIIKSVRKEIKAYYDRVNEIIERYNAGETIEVDQGTVKNPKIVKYKKGKNQDVPLVKTSNDAIPFFAHQQALNEGLASDVRNNSAIEVDLGSLVETTYSQKKWPSSYIEFLGNFYSIGEDVLFNGNVPVLKGIAEVHVEMGSSGRSANKAIAAQYGVDMVKVAPRIMPKPKKFTSKAKGSIIDAEYMRSLMDQNHPSVKMSRSPKQTQTIAEAVSFSRSTNNETKGISVLDFDDTLATTKSNVLFTAPDGTTGKLTAEEFARRGSNLLEQGYVFDFSEFNKVVEGKTAPLFEKALKLARKFGTDNMYILTARSPQAQTAIKEFLDANGLNIPADNIVGLGRSEAHAKAEWIAKKIGEGFNDFYFADDAIQNVKAVENMLDQFDVKSKVQQARVKFSRTMGQDFNMMIEEITGLNALERFSLARARRRGAGKGRFRFFIPPSHEDLMGLLYNFIGKGKLGNKHRAFWEKALIKPLNRGMRELDLAKQSIASDFKALNKEFQDVKKKLKNKMPDSDFTFEDAIRVYIWNKNGHRVPGLTWSEQRDLANAIARDPRLKAYADSVQTISKQRNYVKPNDTWQVGDIRTDLNDATGKVGRAKYLAEFLENAKKIFSEENLNKIEAEFGRGVREAIEDMLYRIETGRNRPSGSNALVNRFVNFINGAVGSVMFFNIRSAVLQQMSIVNFLNFADNNIFAAAKAFANQKQFWADFAYIFNSPEMKQRRGGIGTDVNGAELAATIKNSRNPIQKVIAELLRLGFTPTQIADSFAIAIGGAPYYRNRVNTYLKQGLSQAEAEARAWEDFQEISQATQQSARPDMVSQQQASPLGKFILAFQNVTSQFNRLAKKAFLDIKNRRITSPNSTQLQSDVSNASRILYYLAVQNLIFYSLQTALFAMMFDDDEDDEKLLKKEARVINGTVDSVLRGAGVYGAIIATIKNMGIKFAEQRGAGYNKDEAAVLLEMLNVSPPLGIKARQIVNAEKTLNYEKDAIEEMETFDIDNPMWSAVANMVTATTNIPTAQVYRNVQNARDALNSQYETWQRVLMGMGWSKWNIGADDVTEGDSKKDNKKKNKLGEPTNSGRSSSGGRERGGR